MTFKKLAAWSALVACLGSFLTHGATEAPREWTDVTGRKLTADLVSQSGGEVTLSIKGKEHRIAVAKLSEADQTYLRELPKSPEPPATPPPAKPQALKIPQGEPAKMEIATRAFPDWNGYYSGRFGKSLKEFYTTSKGIVDAPATDTNTTAETAVMWEKKAGTGQMLTFVPPDYDGTVAYGVLIYISPGNGGVNLRPGWDKLFAEKKLIYCSPFGAGNEQADMRRIALALDSVATISANYKTDPNRLFVSGTSGGGAMATTIGVNYAEFKAIDCSRGSFPTSAQCFPYLDAGDIREVARQKKKFAWVSGPKDANYASIQLGVAAWNKAGVQSKLFEHPEQGHAAATADLMDQALTWLESSKK